MKSDNFEIIVAENKITVRNLNVKLRRWTCKCDIVPPQECFAPNSGLIRVAADSGGTPEPSVPGGGGGPGGGRATAADSPRVHHV